MRSRIHIYGFNACASAVLLVSYQEITDTVILVSLVVGFLSQWNGTWTHLCNVSINFPYYLL